MADDRLPIVFTPEASSKLVMFLIPGLLAAAAVWKALDDRFSTVRIRLFGEVDAHVVAWFVATILGAVSLLGLAMLVLRCPRLTLREEGIVIARCFRAPVTIPWSALAHVVVRTARFWRGWRNEVVDVVYLVTKDGTETSPGPLGKGSDIAPVIRRVAARMTAGLPEA
jgi:hypothetical protein